ncbi:nucleotidyltransferase domain-containing protein [Pontibacter sp. E15-1]|uniref:nucleotidyltransferase family protein n=1 Tax=Pontibacter sp. E15-1 TaxID=2919918 RepID=UPI001F501BEA|nr:nucleotidyltransferase domain-containing protein [Pontibacter sp. E15-1]MCJ8163739.1 nucleotidyltransferase domain-containing protein [Pontibacter sp. E15-1]
MDLQEEIRSKAKAFIALCSSHQVKYLYAFGSSVTDRFDEEKSDIDLLVEIDAADPVESGEMLMSLWDELEAFFDRKVDLLTESCIRNPFLKKSIDATKVLVYDGSGEKVLI